MNLLQYIKQNYDKFTDREKLIADYLLLENIKIVDMSAKEIAEATKTSAPTVVRFAKKLGFSSLNEMKIKLSISLNEKKSNGEFEYLDKDLSTISEEELDKAVELLTNAKTIYIFSVGVSSLVGLDFYYKLSRINKRCIVHEDTHLQVTSSVLMQEGDVAVVISYSGETKEVLL